MKRMLFIMALIFTVLMLPACRSAKIVSPLDGKKCFSVNGVTFNMIRVDGGTFSMGATPEQGERVDYDEKPVHKVTVDGFYMGETEVTQELWSAVMGYNHSLGGHLRQCPVEHVTWDEVQLFLEKINSITGQDFRLPTEAEWEFAARGGNKSKGFMYPGSNDVDEVAWYNKDRGSGDLIVSGETHPVKTKKPNELGLYDMSGNAWEWCQDCYDDYGPEDLVNPNVNLPECDERVVRGGSALGMPTRISSRIWCSGYDLFAFIGFRLALSGN